MVATYTGNISLANRTAGDCNWDIDWIRNTRIQDLIISVLKSQNRVLTGCLCTDAGGLDVSIAAGTIVVATVEHTVSSGLVTATAAPPDGSYLTNYVYIDSAGATQISTTPPTGNFVLLGVIDTDDTDILRVVDLRAFQVDITDLATKVDFTSSNGSVVLVGGTTAQRDGTPSTGYLRFNTDAETDPIVEFYDGSYWVDITTQTGGSGVPAPKTPIPTANTTVTANDFFYLFDVSGGGITATMPSSPSVGDLVYIGDYDGNCNSTDDITVTSTANINGSSSDYVISTANSTRVFEYINSTVGWRVVLTGGSGITEIWTGSAGNATTIDWSSSGYLIKSFDEVKVVGLVAGSSAGNGYSETTIPTALALTGNRIAVANFGLSGTSANECRIDVTSMTDTDVYVEVAQNAYTGTIVGIYGINHN